MVCSRRERIRLPLKAGCRLEISLPVQCKGEWAPNSTAHHTREATPPILRNCGSARIKSQKHRRLYKRKAGKVILTAMVAVLAFLLHHALLESRVLPSVLTLTLALFWLLTASNSEIIRPNLTCTNATVVCTGMYLYNILSETDETDCTNTLVSCGTFSLLALLVRKTRVSLKPQRLEMVTSLF